jgi:hypothetical protein
MRSRRAIIFLLSLVFTGAAVSSFIYFWPGSMEGFWWSHKLDCICETYSFLYFHDGEVVQYQEDHLPPVYLGSYRKIGWDTYEFIQIAGKDSNGQQKTQRFVLHPGLFYCHFGRDGEHQGPWWVPLITHFYRARDDAKNQAVLKKAHGMKIDFYPNNDA